MDTDVTHPRAVAVIGLGYVGLPLAVALSGAGVRVVGFDHEPAVVSRLSVGDSHVRDVSDLSVRAALAGTLAVTSSPDGLSGCDTFIICVPTPLSANGKPDTSHIVSAVDTIRGHLRHGSLVVLESTSYPGTTEDVVAAAIERETGLRAGIDVCVAFSPERVDPGNAEYGLSTTPKLVAGLLDCCRDRTVHLYAPICGTVVPMAGLKEAELAKLLENTYRQVNIALVNEMVKFCRALDIDLYEAIRGAATKPFGFQAFYPGPGVGGHCIPIDPAYLASHVSSELGYAFRFVELAQEINDGMPAYVVTRLATELADRPGGLDGARVLLLGVTYKADVPDIRQSPAHDLLRHLQLAGAEVSYLDPLVDSWVVDGQTVPRVAEAGDAAGQFDATILVVHHADFAGLDLAALAPVCLDTRGRLSGAHVRRL